MKKRVNIILAVVITVSALFGTWLITSPSLEKKENLNQQNELIASIESKTVIQLQLSESDNLSDNTVIPEPIFILEPELTQDTVPITPVPAGTELGILTIKKINLKLPVLESVEKEQLKIAIGHVSETPAVGKIGNAVIAGHRNYTYGTMFNRLGEIEIGDIIAYAPIDGEPMQFRVFEIAEIEPGDQIAFLQPKDESIITLYTCTPIREATHRLLVRAVKI